MINLNLMPKKFSEFLEELIQKSGLGKKEIAYSLGITGSYVSGLTTGRNPPPPLDLLRRLAKVLNLSEREEAELLYLAIEERSPDVLEYLVSEEGAQVLKDKGKEIYQAFMDPSLQKHLEAARRFFAHDAYYL
jgi:transcriptional regulator with XRE-family HTH domain